VVKLWCVVFDVTLGRDVWSDGHWFFRDSAWAPFGVQHAVCVIAVACGREAVACSGVAEIMRSELWSF
jgi:hypothetical protein